MVSIQIPSVFCLHATILTGSSLTPSSHCVHPRHERSMVDCNGWTVTCWKASGAEAGNSGCLTTFNISVDLRSAEIETFDSLIKMCLNPWLYWQGCAELVVKFSEVDNANSPHLPSHYIANYFANTHVIAPPTLFFILTPNTFLCSHSGFSLRHFSLFFWSPFLVLR